MHCPNISGRVGASDWAFMPNGSFDGVFRASQLYKFRTACGTPQEVGSLVNIVFRANDSNGHYGKSDTIQPHSIRYMTLIRT